MKHIHNPSSPCACSVEFEGDSHSIKYCQQHSATSELLAACRKFAFDYCNNPADLARYRAAARAAIEKATA